MERGQILHVDCDCFFAAVEMRDQPEYQNVPLAIGGSSDRRGVISTCNYPARKYGVRSAMATSQALKLCPELKLLPGNMAKYKEVSQQVMAILKTYALEFEQVSVDEAYVQLAPCSNGILVAKQIREQVEREVGITVSVGIAPNKFLAKVASDWRKPNGQFAILRHEIADFVENLPLKKIPGVGPKSAQKLENMGMETCGHVQRFSQVELLNRFGRFGQLLFERCRGIDNRSLSKGRERKSISIERTFSEDLDLQKTADIKAVLNGMWPKFNERLENAKLLGQNLAPFVKVKFSDFHVTTLADHHVKAGFDEYCDLLSQAISRSQLPVRLLGIGGRLIKTDAKQLQLDL